jgi:hypothetical protein
MQAGIFAWRPIRYEFRTRSRLWLLSGRVHGIITCCVFVADHLRRTLPRRVPHRVPHRRQRGDCAGFFMCSEVNVTDLRVPQRLPPWPGSCRDWQLDSRGTLFNQLSRDLVDIQSLQSIAFQVESAEESRSRF